NRSPLTTGLSRRPVNSTLGERSGVPPDAASRRSRHLPRLGAMTSRGRADERALLSHHGDVDAETGMLDFEVNVRQRRPPSWLRDRLAAALDRLGCYPSAAEDAAARSAVAARHGRQPDDVLVLNGAAEGFALLPLLRPKLAAVVHPSFTEPDVAL